MVGGGCIEDLNPLNTVSDLVSGLFINFVGSLTFVTDLSRLVCICDRPWSVSGLDWVLALGHSTDCQVEEFNLVMDCVKKMVYYLVLSWVCLKTGQFLRSGQLPKTVWFKVNASVKLMFWLGVMGF